MRLAAGLGVSMFACASLVTAATPPHNHFKSFYINCATPTSTAQYQFCPRPPARQPFATIKTSAPPVTVTYIAGGSHCSPVAMIIYVDGKRVGETPKLNANGIGKLSFTVKPDVPHKLAFEVQGFVGGCNTGELIGIAGKTETTYAP